MTNGSGYADRCCVDEVGPRVQKLVRMIQIFERDEIKPHGFTTSQAYVLLTIKERGPLSMQQLSEVMNLDTSTMTRVVKNLVRDQWLKREQNAEDRRQVMVDLSKEGLMMVEKLDNSVSEYYQKIIRNLPEGRVDEVLEAIDYLTRAFEKANPKCC